MCGILGCFSVAHRAADLLRQGLPFLQHRGQDAVGAFFVQDAENVSYRQKGLVAPFLETLPTDLSASFALGHCRYATVAKTDTDDCAQPLILSEPCSLALAHNGQFHCIVVPSETAYDSLYFLSQCQAMLTRQLAAHGTDFGAFVSVFSRFLADWQGAFSVLLYIQPWGLLAFRDPRGIRPFVWARRTQGDDTQIVFASESLVLSEMGFEDIHVVERGSLHCVSREGTHRIFDYHPPEIFSPCLFEFLYFSSSRSIFEGVPIIDVRHALGQALAAHVQMMVPDFSADLVMSIPASGDPFAHSFAAAIGIPFVPVLQLRTDRRSFLLFSPEERRETVTKKFSLDASSVAGRVVAVVDDGLVRGLTSSHVFRLLRQAGAARLIFLLASPPVRHVNRYGIFIPTEEELFAHGRSDEDICRALGVDAFYYLSIPEIQATVRQLYPCSLSAEVSSFM